MKNKINILMLKFRMEFKNNLLMLGYFILYPMIMYLIGAKKYSPQSIPVGFTSLSITILFWNNKKSLETFLRFGVSRIRYFKYRLSEAVITTLIITALLSTYYYFSLGENMDSSVVAILACYYFTYIILCHSVKIFAELVNNSHYATISYAMIFLYGILFLRYGFWIIISDIETIMLNFNKVMVYELIIIIFNICMSYISLKTIEIQ